MDRPGGEGPNGTRDRGGGVPGGRTVPGATSGSPPGDSVPTPVPVSRVVMLGEPETRSEKPVELTDEEGVVDEESAAPLIDDAAVSLEPDEPAAPAVPPAPAVQPAPPPRASVPPPGRPRSEPPPTPGRRSVPPGAPPLPGPPSFLAPFREAVAEAGQFRPAAQRPAVAPPPAAGPVTGVGDLPAAGLPDALPPYAAAPPAPAAFPLRPSSPPLRATPAPLPLRPSSPLLRMTPPPVGVGLPKVIVSEEAFRPAPPPQPAPPLAPPAPPPAPSFPQPAAPPLAAPPAPTRRSPTPLPVPGWTPPPPTPPAPMLRELPPDAPLPPDLEPEADEELEEAAGFAGAEQPALPEAAAGEEAAAPLEATAAPETAAPATALPERGGIGLLDELAAEAAADKAFDDVFAPPEAPAAEVDEFPPPAASIPLDAVPSVITIPEDEIPRGPLEAPVPSDEVASPVPAPAFEPEAPAEAPAGAAEAVEALEAVEVLTERDLRSIEPGPPDAGIDAVPVVVAEKPRRVPVPARPKPRRRRRRGERKPWWEDIFDDEYIRSLPKYTAEHTRREVDFIERGLSVEKGARILDLGCGDGRQAVELAARGYEVVGFDLSLPMLARAGEAAQARGVKINFIQGDMRDLRFETAFDAAYVIGTSFGYFDDETNSRVLAGVYRALKPGGRFLLDACNRDYVQCNQPRSTWFQGDDRQFLEDTDFNYITSRLVVRRSWATTAGDQESVEYSVRLYALHELGQILHANGFKVTEVSGSYATPGVFLGSDATQVIILSEKPRPPGAAAGPPPSPAAPAAPPPPAPPAPAAPGPADESNERP